MSQRIRAMGITDIVINWQGGKKKNKMIKRENNFISPCFLMFKNIVEINQSKFQNNYLLSGKTVLDALSKSAGSFH